MDKCTNCGKCPNCGHDMAEEQLEGMSPRSIDDLHKIRAQKMAQLQAQTAAPAPAKKKAKKA